MSNVSNFYSVPLCVVLFNIGVVYCPKTGACAMGSNINFSFVAAHLVLYVYPFLNTTDTSRPFEYLRLTSLGVVGALVKVNILWKLKCLGHGHSYLPKIFM